jgi:predicted Co/Zn/Cd cation transporter (cation efflux family)
MNTTTTSTAMLLVDVRSRWFYLPMVLAIALISGYSSLSPCHKDIDRFVQSLNEKQRELYSEIKKERYNIFQSSIMTAIFFAFLYTIYTILMGCHHWYHFFANLLLIVLGTVYVLYMVTPKKRCMLKDGQLTVKETEEWSDIYQCMSSHFWVSFMYGLVGSIALFVLIDIIAPPHKMALSVPVTSPMPSIQKVSKSKSRSKKEKK